MTRGERALLAAPNRAFVCAYSDVQIFGEFGAGPVAVVLQGEPGTDSIRIIP